MFASSLGKFVLPAALLSGAVFSSLTLPLVLFGSEPVTIQLKEEPIFYGKLKDIAAPYVGVAAVLSLGAGAASVAISGWQQSSRKSGQVEAQLSHLQQELKQKEVQLEEMLLSDSRLETAGLKFFLEEEANPGQPAPVPVPIQQPLVVETEAPAVQTWIFAAQPETVPQSPVAPPAVTAHAAALHAAQVFLSYSRANVPAPAPAPETLMAETEPSPVAKVKELQDQLRQIMTQIEGLQGALEAEEAARPAATAEPNTVLHHLNHRLQKLETQWAMQRIAS